ncbi:MAG: class I SAM-dependent methyltransferase [Chloroflexota bacterium]|nr:class I SAM-dependent methyltransferase [Chloroflexota bacterium]
MTDLAAVKQRQQQTWAAGDFSVIATALYPMAEVLCDDVNFSSGQTVLDVACGSGNVAIAAARRHAAVTGIDYVPALLDRARQRATAERLEITFQAGDAEALPFEDGTFDVVLSAFGVMFAPNQEQAAAELLRVCRPGGRIGLANWTPASAPAGIFRLSAQFAAAPPPPGLQPPIAWGTASRLRELFGDHAASIRLHDRVYLARYDSAEHFVDTFRAYFGPVHNTFATLDPQQAAEYAAGLAGITHQFNRATDGTLAVANAYVTVVIDRA